MESAAFAGVKSWVLGQGHGGKATGFGTACKNGDGTVQGTGVQQLVALRPSDSRERDDGD